MQPIVIKQSYKQIISSKKPSLKKVTGKKEFSAIEATIKANESTTKRQLHQRKLKEFKSFKYKPSTTKNETTEPTKKTNIWQSYAGAVKENNIISRTYGNISRKSTSLKSANKKPTLLQKLERLNLTNIQHQLAKSRTRIHSKAKQNLNSIDEAIEKLEKEIQLLKQTENETKHVQVQTTLKESSKNETSN